MKKKVIITSTIVFVILLLAVLVGLYVEKQRIQRLNSSVSWTSEDIYNLIDKSTSFHIEQTYYDLLSERCNYNIGGTNFILTQVKFEEDSYIICLPTYNDWEEAWNHANDWNNYAKKNNWAIGKVMYSFGAVLVQINPINDNFLDEFTSLITIE